jgi:hypothetical protein
MKIRLSHSMKRQPQPGPASMLTVGKAREPGRIPAREWQKKHGTPKGKSCNA